MDTPSNPPKVKLNQKSNLLLRQDTLKAIQVFQQKEIVNRYNNYSKYIVNQYLKDFTKRDFWKTMQSAMLAHDELLTPSNVIIGICDEYSDGVYLPSEKKMILCSNVLVRKPDFEDGVHRQLIKFYDHVRTENYSPSNCRHHACSEVRAAGFSNKCNMASVRLSKLKGK